MKGLFDGLMSFLRKLPVARMIKPLWKSGVKRLIISEGDKLQVQVRSLIDDDKDASLIRVNKIMDGWQVGLIKGVRALSFIPGGFLDQICDKIQSEGDVLQERLVSAIKEGGPSAVDAAFDGLQVRMSEYIDAR